jgi:HSP20 family protein
MFGLARRSPFDELFNFQRELDRVFNQFWTHLPTRMPAEPGAFQVSSGNDEWQIKVPLPGLDPKNVKVEVAGNAISIRAEQGAESKEGPSMHFEQTLTVPQFLDIDNIRASHQHGMLQLTLPVNEAVKPRRIPITADTDQQKQLSAA